MENLSDEHLKAYAATKIASGVRGHLVRSASRAQAEADELERSQEAYYEAEVVKDMAAKRIQAAWLAYRNHRIYCYYRDLIQFRERGDPRDLLR